MKYIKEIWEKFRESDWFDLAVLLWAACMMTAWMFWCASKL